MTAPIEPSNRRTERGATFLVLALAFVAAVYSNAPLGDFVWDDTSLVLDQSIVRELRPIGNYFDQMFFGGPEGAPTRAFYRPLVILSFALDWRVWGGSPLGFHLTNVALHLLACGLVYLLARREGASAAASAFVTAAFGAFPRSTEAVAWISGRTDLLATVFVLAALLVHERAAGRRCLGACLLFLGLLSKEVAFAGAAAIAVREFVWWRRSGGGLRSIASAALPLVACASIYLAIRMAVQQAYQVKTPGAPLGLRLLTALEAVGSYFWMVLDPLRPRTQIGAMGEPRPVWIALGAVVLLVAVLGAVRWWRSERNVSPQAIALVVLAVVPILLVLHLVPLPMNFVAADRFLYLPSAAAAVGIAAWSRGWRHARAARIAACVVIAAFGAAAHARVDDWRSETALWSEAIQHRPRGNAYPLVRYAEALIREDRPEEALPLLLEAREIERELWARTHLGDAYGSEGSLGLAYAAMGRYAEAGQVFQALVDARPRDPSNAYNLAVVRALDLDFDSASRGLREILSRYPAHEGAAQELRVVADAKLRWEALGPEFPGERADVRLERAKVYASLGRRRDACRLAGELRGSEASDERVRVDARRLAELNRCR